MEQYLGTSILSAQLAIIAIPTILLIGFSIMGLRHIICFCKRKRPTKGELADIEDIEKTMTSYSNFFDYYKITQVLERHLSPPLLRSRHIRQEIERVLDELYLADRGKQTRSMVTIYVLEKKFNIFCIKQGYDNGNLCGYGFSTNDGYPREILPAIIRSNGLPSDIGRVVRYIQKKCLIDILHNPSTLLRVKWL